MTDADPHDELASAYLDGMATPDEQARVQADPILLARVATLRAVRAAVHAPPPVDEAARDDAIAAALLAFDADTPADTIVRRLPPLAERRGGRSWRIVGVAAAVALLALVPLLASRSSDSDDGGDDDLAVSGLDEPVGVADDAKGAPAAGTAPMESSSVSTSTTLDPSSAAEYPMLGSFEDDDALWLSLRTAVGSEAYLARGDGPDASGCLPTLLASLPPGEVPTLRATAVVAGVPVAVLVTGTEVHIARGDCGDVQSRPR